ncbi:hypothetical protein MPNT_100019 [Candidatus Methylacidithermus pantelleriae]|uniref:Uncharacterized protein n=1 Tax=Candidatus Methylacidithermus pantelleriae TaxID=2744239 RepID=A0A8J2BQR4_9BACT|nr:hypothetical protein MPNT_100019 [Candidatus Methylacidithermus pantelleriae]
MVSREKRQRFLNFASLASPCLLTIDLGSGTTT